MIRLAFILSVIGFTAKAQDSTTLRLLTDNVNAYKLVIASQLKEIDRQDKLIFELTDSVINLNKRLYALNTMNATLKKRNNKQELWFKIGNGILSGLILYFTSR